MQDPVDSALEYGLCYLTDDSPGITRRRSGRGFTYTDASGNRVTDAKTIERIRSIVIPPAWTDVWISPAANSHLQATGRDARGRKQYRYHPRWRETRDGAKFDNLLNFAGVLPAIREQVAADLRKRGLPREKVLAAVVRLLELTAMRVGNESYARENDSYGLTTLRDRHVRVDGSTLRFRVYGKSGKEHRCALHDAQMARIVKRSRDLPGQLLFQYEDDDGSQHRIESSDVNTYLREITGGDYTAKDFRTWAGTVMATSELSELEPPESTAAADRAIVQAIDSVAGTLGNTRAVCRTSYIHPAVFEAFRSGDLHEMARKSRRWKITNGYGLDLEELLTARIIAESQNCSAND